MSSWRLRWFVIGPVVMFVLGSLMLSCGGSGSSCGGSYDAFGNYVPGVCPGSGPVVGYNLESIVIASGAAPTETPTPTPTKGHPTPTPTLTPVPQATTTAVEVGGQAVFHAVGTFVKHSKVHIVDITNSSDMLWTSRSDQNALVPPGPGNGGIYGAVAVGCACIDASAGGVVAPPVGVTVYSNSTATPSCALCETPTATPTPGLGVTRPTAPASSVLAGTNAAATLQWTFDAQMPIAGALKPAPDGGLYFVTADGMLHALDASGRQRWQHITSATAPAVSDNGTVFALGPGADLYALSPEGRLLWTTQLSSAQGPLAAAGDTVFIQADGELNAVAAPGTIRWQVPAPTEFSEAAATPDGGVVAGTGRGDVIAIAPNGRVRWRFTPEGGLAGTIAVAGNRVYLGSVSGTVYALDAGSGNQIWQFDTTQTVGSGPVAGFSGLVFFQSDALYAVRANGTVVWSKSLKPDEARAPLASDPLGGVLAPAAGERNVLLNPDGSIRWSTRSFGQVEQAAVSSSGVLFVAANDNRIYALR